MKSSHHDCDGSDCKFNMRTGLCRGCQDHTVFCDLCNLSECCASGPIDYDRIYEMMKDE